MQFIFVSMLAVVLWVVWCWLRATLDGEAIGPDGMTDEERQYDIDNPLTYKDGNYYRGAEFIMKCGDDGPSQAFMEEQRRREEKGEKTE